MAKRGQSSPWGEVQSVTKISHGIRQVSAAGHGGVLVSASYNAKIPAYMRNPKGAYEEDCDWAIPVVVFQPQWRKWAEKIGRSADVLMDEAINTLRNWHPEAYETFTGSRIEEGESLLRDEANLNAKLRDQYVVVAAWGSWHPKVPTGWQQLNKT